MLVYNKLIQLFDKREIQKRGHSRTRFYYRFVMKVHDDQIDLQN